MTYIVYDGKTMISDCLVSTLGGSRIIGRKPIGENGLPQLNRDAPSVEIYYDDCRKMHFPTNAKYRGHPIKVLTLAGSAKPLNSIFGAFNTGVDFDDYIRVDISVQPMSDRHVFNGHSSFLFLDDKDKCYHIHCIGSRVVVEEKEWGHIGSGRTIVDSVRALIPGIMQGKAPDLTSLEAYVLAAGQTETVSETFDYYIPSTGEYKTNQRLSKRQQELILDRIQKRIKLSDTCHELIYANRLPAAK